MNFDDWKLSNPTDDGIGYNMVSSCCEQRLEKEMSAPVVVLVCGEKPIYVEIVKNTQIEMRCAVKSVEIFVMR